MTQGIACIGRSGMPISIQTPREGSAWWADDPFDNRVVERPIRLECDDQRRLGSCVTLPSRLGSDSMTTDMTTRKTAIAVPEELLARVDAIARERGQSRSRFINDVLREAVRARRDAEITRRLDALFAEPEVADEQRRLARELADAGIDWKERGW